MSKIPTAEEFMKSQGCNYTLEKGKLYFSDVTKEDLIEFTKLHVEAALEEAIKKGKCSNGTSVVIKDSILNSYSLENIK